jgi:DNA repair photolyase
MFYNAKVDGVRYQEITVKTALTRVHGMPYFSWSLNPYRGCAHACSYCYAREYHAKMGRDTGAGFDREVEVKINFPDALRAELRRLRLRETVALGTGTDPYQPCEGRYRLTRRTLEALVESPLPLVIVTKGTLVVRDIDLLVRLARLTSVRVCFSVGTMNAQVARTSEPEAAPPRSRLEALRRLRTAGLDAGVLAAPILPGLSDTEESLDAVARAAREHDATFFHHRPLKLDPGVRPHYFTFLAEHFPVLLPNTSAQFADRVHADRRYTDELEERVERVRARYGFDEDRSPAPAARPIPPRVEAPEPAQLRLSI